MQRLALSVSTGAPLISTSRARPTFAADASPRASRPRSIAGPLCPALLLLLAFQADTIPTVVAPRVGLISMLLVAAVMNAAHVFTPAYLTPLESSGSRRDERARQGR